MTNYRWDKSRKIMQASVERHSDFVALPDTDTQRINIKQYLKVGNALIPNKRQSLRAGYRSKRPVSLAPVTFKDDVE